MPRVDADFKEQVYRVVGSIPRGKLMTYGGVAAVAGAPWAAWEVGQLAHRGPKQLPWQRVVNKQGGLASAYTRGGFDGHKKELEADGVEVSPDYHVKLETYLWQPKTLPN